MALLHVEDMSLRFGGNAAVRSLSFSVEPGEALGLIGPNGAGKTCVFNCISGFYRPCAGSIVFGGRPLLPLRPDQRAALGLARTFQNLRLFPQLSAEENVLSGTHCRTRARLVSSLLRLPSQVREEREARAQSRYWLEFVGLTGEARRAARTLPYGAQRRLEIARAMAVRPKLLLLDEPAAGLNIPEKIALMHLIHRIREAGVTLLLIDHDMNLVMSIASRLIVLDHGEKLTEGAPDEVRRDPRVIEAYLGKDTDEDVESAP
ncbi:ABC transporter ATP-binding protein [Sorangium cellulosum]|uniref:ABC transporter ATP-binding protein n=1 Tax=Sorangium cellulosum TaxID=56 RepID=A0A150R6N7_SORCE|nr:ABC transporter ATP-binding protein [Sorangium cellulosum]